MNAPWLQGLGAALGWLLMRGQVDLGVLVGDSGARRHEYVVGRWRARPFQVRMEVEDGLVTIQVSGVLGGDADRMIRDELLADCRLAKEIRLDLCAVSEVQSDVRLATFLGQLRSDCELTRCRLQVTATHPLVLQVLKSWGNRLEYLNR